MKIPVPQPPARVQIFGQPITLARVVGAVVILVVSFARPAVVVVGPVAPVQDDGLRLLGVLELVA